MILTKNNASSMCHIPLCASCKTHLTCQTPALTKVTQNPSQLMALSRNDLTVGQKVSLDQYVSSRTGHLPHTKGSKPTAMKFTGGHFLLTTAQNSCSCRTKYLWVQEKLSSQNILLNPSFSREPQLKELLPTGPS